MELTPSILDASDLDVPPGVLTFRVERPPAHGTLIRAPHGEVGAERLQKSLPVPSFTLQELRQGETGFKTINHGESLCLLFLFP